MTEKFVYAVIAMDHALVWKDGLEPGAKPDRIDASSDNPDYKKQHDAGVGHRDRSEMDPKFAEMVAKELSNSMHIYLVSAGSGKANSAHQLVDYLDAKHPDIAHKILGTGTADVNALSNDQLLELGRDRKLKFIQTE
jgi:hypothetical protein